MRRTAITTFALLLLTSRASAQPEPPVSPPEPTPAPEPDAEPDTKAEPTAEPKSDAGEDQERLRKLEAELARLRRKQAEMREELDALKRKQAETPSVRLPPKEEKKPTLSLEPTASVALRYDNLFPHDPDGRFRGEPYVDGFRMRVRAGVRTSALDAAVVGGVRVALGQPQNPAVGYVTIGDAFRVAPVSMDRFWASLRPFDDRDVLQITAGKMPNPFWRGDRGRFRSELVWDTDVNPTGIAMNIEFLDYDGVVVDNTAGYYVVHDLEDLRFVGLTGPVSLIANQLRVRWTYVTGAFAFYDYENLNSGLSAPGPDSTQAGTHAFLLRDGPFRTNNRVSHGVDASGFVTEAFRFINPSAAGHIPLPLEDIGRGSELFMMVDYSYNLSVSEDRHGIGGTAGVRTGDHDGGWISPLELWFTYRLVEADAVLATFADSNLGMGTDFRGFEVGATYEAVESVALSLGYFDFLGAPNMEAQVRRFFVDVRWDH